MSNCAQYDETCDCSACTHDRDRGYTSSGARLPRTRIATAEEVERSANLYGLIAGQTYTIPPSAPFNEDAERVAFCDWYRNTNGCSPESAYGGWNGREPAIAWSAWLARAKA